MAVSFTVFVKASFLLRSESLDYSVLPGRMVRAGAGGAKESALARGTDWNRKRFRGLGRSQHVAAAVENASGLNHQAGRVNLTRNHSLGLNLDAALGENHAIEPPGNGDVIAFDLTLYLRVFAKNEALFRKDVSLHFAVQPENPREMKSPFQPDALVHEPDPVFSFTRFVATRPFPGQGSPLHVSNHFS
jgi:hypothetical protein